MGCVTCICVWLGAGGSCWGRVGGVGGEWVRGSGFGFTNPGGKWGLCFGCGGVGGVGGGGGGVGGRLGPGSGRMVWCYASCVVSLDSLC